MSDPCCWIVLCWSSFRKLTAQSTSLSNNALLHVKFHSQPLSLWLPTCCIRWCCCKETRYSLGNFSANDSSPPIHLSSQNLILSPKMTTWMQSGLHIVLEFVPMVISCILLLIVIPKIFNCFRYYAMICYPLNIYGYMFEDLFIVNILLTFPIICILLFKLTVLWAIWMLSFYFISYPNSF